MLRGGTQTGRTHGASSRAGASSDSPVYRRTLRPKSPWYAIVLVTATTVTLASCASPTTNTPSGQPVEGATVTIAEPPAQYPNYIFPMYSGANWTAVNNGYLEPQLYPPLYWFGNNGQPTVNPALSLAELPTYSANGRTITITLKPYHWSDGKPVTTRDVEFWINLLKANKLQYGPYFPGGFPDDLVSATYSSPTTFSLTFNKAYNHDYLLSQLSIITPIPQQVWDKPSASASIGNYDLTTSGAEAVYKFLNAQSQQLSTYATNPLWQVVDGPFHLKAFTVQGEVTLVPNSNYSGPVKPKIAKLIEEPFTSATSEFNVLRAGDLTYGYIPATQYRQVAALKSLGYDTDVWPGWQASWASFNFKSGYSWSALIAQPYIREAMQLLVDQPAIASGIYQHTAYPTYGPVPSVPRSPYVSPYTGKPTYSYSPSNAISLLRSHGWTVRPNGTSTCAVPSKCGSGISAGAQLSFPTMYISGDPSQDAMFQDLQSTFSLAGIRLELSSFPTTTVLSLQVCTTNCKWAISFGGIGWIYYPYPYPDGGVVWKTGSAGSAVGGYSNSQANRLIDADQVTNNLTALYRLEDYLAKSYAALWLPTPANQISEVKMTLHGVNPQDPTEAIEPQYWYLTK